MSSSERFSRPLEEADLLRMGCVAICVIDDGAATERGVFATVAAMGGGVFRATETGLGVLDEDVSKAGARKVRTCWLLPSVSLSAYRNSSAVANRCAGSLASARITAAETAIGTWSATWWGGTMAWCICPMMIS